MNKLTAVILDDERRGREVLKQLLEVHCPNVKVMALTENLDEAIDALLDHRPDILFLDIRLGSDFGLDILPFLPQPEPAIIITTAHPEFAIKAIRAKALDYLLKPVISDELKAAVKKVTEARESGGSAAEPIHSHHAEGYSQDKKITLPTMDGLIFVKIKNIIRCEADGAYTLVVLKEEKNLLVSINLGEFEKMLPESLGFFRVHHSTLINTSEIRMYVKNDGGYVVMSDEKKVPVSQRKKTDFLNFIKDVG